MVSNIALKTEADCVRGKHTSVNAKQGVETWNWSR